MDSRINFGYHLFLQPSFFRKKENRIFSCPKQSACKVEKESFTSFLVFLFSPSPFCICKKRLQCKDCKDPEKRKKMVLQERRCKKQERRISETFFPLHMQEEERWIKFRKLFFLLSIENKVSLHRGLRRQKE